MLSLAFSTFQCSVLSSLKWEWKCCKEYWISFYKYTVLKYMFIYMYVWVCVCIYRASLVAQMVKNLPAMQGTPVQSLGWEDPLEKGMATHSSIFVWRIPWTEVPDGLLQSTGSQSQTHTERLSKHKYIYIYTCVCVSLCVFVCVYIYIWRICSIAWTMKHVIKSNYTQG